MTLKQVTSGKIDIQALLDGDEDYLRTMVSAIVEATLEAEVPALARGAAMVRRHQAARRRPRPP